MIYNILFIEVKSNPDVDTSTKFWLLLSQMIGELL